MNTVVLEVRSLADTLADATRAMKTRRSEREARIAFATPELLWQVLTAKRWELLKALCGAGRVSIREAARRVYAFVYFRFWTGTRPSEAIALRHSFLNLKQRRFNVVASRVLGSDGRPKTRKSKRKVEIHANLADVLKDYVGSSRQDPDAFVFTTATGSPIDEANFYERHWKPMLLRLGIRKRPFYNTRHTYVTVMHVDLGMPPLWICRQTGMSLAMIENHYGGGQVSAEEIDARIAEHDASRNPAGTLRTRPAKGRAAQGRNAKKISALRRRAGDRGRTGDVQLGKLAFYR